MTVHASSQDPTETQHIVARVLGIPDAFVTVETRRMGGGFGGKESQACTWAAMAALAARVTGRPCKVRLDRDDDFMLTGKRHDFRADWRVGFDDRGVVAGYDVALNARCGCSADLSPGVVDRAMFHAGNGYWLPHVSIASRRLKTNTVSNTAFRGFGGPQGMIAIERVMDAIARERGLDPLDVRKASLLRPGFDGTPYGQTVVDLETQRLIIDELEATSRYRDRRAAIAAFNASSPIIKRGIALTPVMFGISFTLIRLNQAGALVHVYSDGSIHLNHGGTEMGQGLFTKVAQIVAEEFGVPLYFVRITATNTSKVPNASPAAASSGTDLNGMAAKIAAGAIKERMAAFAAEQWGVGADAVEFRDGRVFAGNASMSFGELAKECRLARVPLSHAGHYKTPEIHWDRAKAQGRPFFYFAFGAACSEVAIDTMTGEMRVLRADLLHDVGASINPALDIGQVEGGFIQGMGWLTTEELVYDAKGRLTTHAPATYKIPVASDVPAVFNTRLHMRGNPTPSVYRSKAVGEPPLMLAISVYAAILDAVHATKPERPSQARRAVHTGGDPQCDPLAQRSDMRRPHAGLPPPHRCNRSRRIGGSGDARPRQGLEPARSRSAHGGQTVRRVPRHDRGRSAGVGGARGCASGAEARARPGVAPLAGAGAGARAMLRRPRRVAHRDVRSSGPRRPRHHRDRGGPRTRDDQGDDRTRGSN